MSQWRATAEWSLISPSQGHGSQWCKMTLGACLPSNCWTARVLTAVTVVDAEASNLLNFKRHRIEAARAAATRKPGEVLQTALLVLCNIHAVCLTRKQVALGIDGLWSGVVRYAHLFESSTFRQDFEAALSQIIRDSFWDSLLAVPLKCTLSQYFFDCLSRHISRQCLHEWSLDKRAKCKRGRERKQSWSVLLMVNTHFDHCFHHHVRTTIYSIKRIIVRAKAR